MVQRYIFHYFFKEIQQLENYLKDNYSNVTTLNLVDWAKFNTKTYLKYNI